MSKHHEKKERFLKTPRYAGGLKAMRTFITQNLQYPKEALDAKVEGTVHLRYDINHKGKVTDAKILSGIGHGCDAEAIRLVKMLTFEVPKNRKVRVVFHKTIQIHFHLPKVKAKPPKPKHASPSIQYQYVPSSTSPKKKSTASPAKSYIYTVPMQKK